MKRRSLSMLFGMLLLSLTLVGCSSGPQLPDGDVKVVKQDVSGVINLLLESADYGSKSTTVASMLLPKDAAYNVNVVLETYEGEEMLESQELVAYQTQTITKESITHIIMNAGSGEVPSIFSISEIDEEKTEDPKLPEFKMTKTYLPALDYDLKVDLEAVGTDLNTDVVLAGYVKFKADDTEKAPIDLLTYKEDVKNYEKAYILKANVSPVKTEAAE